MERNRLLIYFAILAIGFIISFYTIRTHFDVKTIATLLFFLIFIPTIINPDIGLIIIIISMLFSPELIIGATVHREITIRTEDIFLLVIIFAWFVRTAFTKDIVKVFKTKLTLPFFSYIAICIISTIFSVIFGGEISLAHSFFSILKYFEYFLLFFMVKDSLKSLRQSKIFIIIFLLTALIVAIYSNVFIGQQIASGSTFFRTSPPIERKEAAGEAGTLGGYFLFIMCIIGGLLLYTRSMPLRIILFCMILLMFRGFLYSLSRGSYLAFIPGIITLVYFTKKGKLILTFILIAGSVLLAVFMPKMVRDRIVTTMVVSKDMEGLHIEWEESPRDRLDSWKMVLFERFPKSPLFGYGVGKYFIDSQIFRTLCEVGLVGLILFIWIFVRLFKMVKDVLDVDLVKNDRFSIGLTVGFLAGFVGLMVHAISTNTFIIIRIMEPFWFIAAIVLSLPDLLMEEKGTLEKVT